MRLLLTGLFTLAVLISFPSSGYSSEVADLNYAVVLEEVNPQDIAIENIQKKSLVDIETYKPVQVEFDVKQYFQPIFTGGFKGVMLRFQPDFIN